MGCLCNLFGEIDQSNMCSNSYVRVLFTNRKPISLHAYNLKIKPEIFLPRTAFHISAVKLYNMFVGRLPVFRQAILPNNYLVEVKNTKLIHTRSAFLYVKRGLQKIPNSLKQHSVHIVKVCTQQCECVIAHRIRRGQQIFSLYSKLWDEVALKELIRKLRQQLSRKGKELILGSVGMLVYNWEKERITDAEMLRHVNELENVHELRKIDHAGEVCWERDMLNWKPFIEKGELAVWRKEVENNGLYAYKVYGCYHDVTAEDFMHVQIDTEFRKEWDTTVVNLQVVEEERTSNSDIVYWEMEWPRMFSNRDYVFNRRFIVLKDRNLILVMNKATEHPAVPEKSPNVRVTEYWSIMVIKALKNIHEPGMEFSLTYFDNPGVNVPSSITSWVAMTGLPDFQMRLRQAARDYKHYLARKKSELSEVTSHLPEEDSSSGSTNRNESRPEEKYSPSASKSFDADSKNDGNSPSKSSPAFIMQEQFGSWTNVHQLHVWQLFV